MHTMSTNFAKTLVWKHGNDVKLWRHKQCTPKPNNHHMTLNQTPPMKIFCVRHCTRCCFGLSNSPQSMQRLMDWLTADLDNVQGYIDDFWCFLLLRRNTKLTFASFFKNSMTLVSRSTCKRLCWTVQKLNSVAILSVTMEYARLQNLRQSKTTQNRPLSNA